MAALANQYRSDCVTPVATDKETQDQYIKGALKKISPGRTHASLGSSLSERSKQKALLFFQHILDQGIAPSDVLVDYGCGTLRIGRHLIEYLDAKNYVGMDIDTRIPEAGLSTLSRDVVRSKKPILELIGDDSINRVAALKPSLVFAKGVLQHIPPSQLDHFFMTLSKLSSGGAVIIVSIKAAKSSQRLSNRSWSYTISDVLASASRARLVRTKTAGVSNQWHHFKSSPASEDSRSDQVGTDQKK
jgi:hypothetical protein